MSGAGLDPLAEDLTARYELGTVLGQGAFGVVRRARERATGREVALKLLQVQRGGTALARFMREGAVVAALDHPGIVRVHAVGTHGGRPCIVYELIEGEPLDRAARTLPHRRRAELVRDAARAVGHAHARGVLHRDLKGGNILVDQAGRARVVDFGLALVEGDERLTRTGAVVGTPTHMAPELFARGRADAGPAADVWALGVVLYEALTGRLPFDAESLVELLARIERGAVTPPRAVDPSIDPALEAVCLRALDADPRGRQADGGALADALEAALAAGEGDPRRRRWWPAAALALGAWAAVPGPTAPGPDAAAAVLGPASDAAAEAPAAAAPLTSLVVYPGDDARWALALEGGEVLVGGGDLVRLLDVEGARERRIWAIEASLAVRAADGGVLLVATEGRDRWLLRLAPGAAGVEGRRRLVFGAMGLAAATRAPLAAFLGSFRRQVDLFDAPTGRGLFVFFPDDGLWCAADLSLDGRRLIASCELATGGGLLLVFDVERPTAPALLARVPLPGLAWQVRLTPGGEQALVGLASGAALLVDVEPPAPVAHALVAPAAGEATTPCVAVAPDGRVVLVAGASAAGGYGVRSWDVTTRAEVGPPLPLPGRPRALDVSPDGRLLVVCVDGVGVVVLARAP